MCKIFTGKENKCMIQKAKMSGAHTGNVQLINHKRKLRLRSINIKFTLAYKKADLFHL